MFRNSCLEKISRLYVTFFFYRSQFCLKVVQISLYEIYIKENSNHHHNSLLIVKTHIWLVFFPLLIFPLSFFRPIDTIAKSKQLDLLVKWNFFFHFNIPKTALWQNTFITININSIWILKWNFFHPWLMILFYVKLNEDMW